MRTTFVLLCLTLTGAASAADPAALDRRVLARLSGYETAASPEALHELAPDAELVASLHRILVGPALPSRRSRAVDTLRHFRGPAVEAALDAALARGAKEPLAFRLATVRSIAIALDRAHASARLLPLLAAKRFHVRIEAAEGLATLGRECDAIASLALRETGDVARERLTPALVRCRSRAAKR